MKKILIFGNSGSGKSFLARRLSVENSLLLCPLDQIFWKPGGCVEKRPKEEVLGDLDQVRGGTNWVIEGSFGDLIERCLPDANLLIFLDPPWKECEENLRRRGSEPEKWADPTVGKSKFDGLVAWAKEYWERTDRFSHPFHLTLFQNFNGRKVRLRSRSEISYFSLKKNL
jgi:adenylate kinase family enzyme